MIYEESDQRAFMIPPDSHSVDPLRPVSHEVLAALWSTAWSTPLRPACLRDKEALRLALTDTEECELAALVALTNTERLALQLAELSRLEVELAKPHTKTELRALFKEKKDCLWEIDLIEADLEPSTWYPRKKKRINKASWRRAVREAKAQGRDLEEAIRRAEKAVSSHFGGHEGSNDTAVARCMARVNDPPYMFKASLA
jgi:hypothetical protein